MKFPDGTLITDHSNHEIFLVQDGRLRWVPDSWTMHSAGLNPADLVVTTDEELNAFEVGEPLASAIPTPSFPQGQIVETESGVWKMEGQSLVRILDPRELVVQADFEPEGVVFLPDSIARGLFRGEEASIPQD